MMVGFLEQEGTLHSFIEDVGKDGSQLTSTGFKAGGGNSVWFWCFPGYLFLEQPVHILFIYSEFHRGGEGVRGMMGVNNFKVGWVELICQGGWGRL